MSKNSQRVIESLRKMIISGELVPGERMAEIPLAERLGVSRTPIRLAFRALEYEGLLHPAGRRGYMVREISAGEVAGAIEVRGVLEGLAARLLAEQGMTRGARATLLESLQRGDDLFRKGSISEQDMEDYHDLNMVFHQTIVEASANSAITHALARNDHLPFASVNSIAIDRNDLGKEFRRFNFAHMQHHIIFDALDNGQGARAEAVMREHANAALRYAELMDGVTAPPENMKIIGKFIVADQTDR